MTNEKTLESKLRWRVLILLMLANILNFVDRQIIGVLAIPIKTDLGLSDRELGLLGGAAFAIFYTTMGLVIARFADRSVRVIIISSAVALWSAFTALCGAAQNFWQLFLTRMGVGIGEAGGPAPSFALIADYFPPALRARALAFFSIGVPIGSALGIFFGGWIASNVDWRSAFFAVGLAGLPVAWAIWKFVPEPRRGGMDHSAVSTTQPPLREVISTIGRKPGYWLMTLATALGALVTFGLIFWLPGVFNRSFGLSLGQLSWFYGSIVLVGGVAGTLLGGWLADRFGPSRPAAYALVPGICILLASPAYAVGLFSPSLPIVWVLFTIGQALGMAWQGPVWTALYRMVQPSMRATVSATILLANNVIGLGFGIYLLGELSTRMAALHGTESLRYSILYVLPVYAVAGLLYIAAAPRMVKDAVQPSLGASPTAQAHHEQPRKPSTGNNAIEADGS